MNKLISIIIVTYNSQNLIRDCLTSIFDNNDIGEQLEVIIVDNASDNQQELFDIVTKEFCDKEIRIYDSGYNYGYGKGNNFGIKKTDAGIIIVMNPDVRLVSPIFKNIIDEFSDQNIGMAGVNFIDGSSPYYFKPEYVSLINSLLMHLYIWRHKYNSCKMYMSGSLLIFRRSVFIDAGLFDENIFMYYEEPDITNRILKLGKDVKWLSYIQVFHLAHGRDYNQTLAQISLTSYEYYCRKYKISYEKGYKLFRLVLKIKKIFSIIIMDWKRYNNFKSSIEAINNRLLR